MLTQALKRCPPGKDFPFAANFAGQRQELPGKFTLIKQPCETLFRARPLKGKLVHP